MIQSRETVLFVSHDASRTGAPIFLLRFLRWLHENEDIELRVLLGRDGELLPEFEALGEVDVFEPRPTIAYRVLRRLNLHHSRLRAHRSRLRKKLLQSGTAIVYANSAASAEMIDFLSFLKAPVICHVHEPEGTIKALGARTMPLLKSRVSLYVAVSGAVKTNLIDTHGIPSEKVRLVENFIPVEKGFETKAVRSRELISRELQISGDAKIVCACGTPNHRKGPDLFLQVASRVARDANLGRVVFIWVGDGPERADYIRQVASSGLADVVHFIGKRDDATAYFAASDIFLMTSREEASPLVTLEASLYEKPVICFDETGYAPEFLRGEAGVVIPQFDVKMMSDRLIELLLSPELCRKMGAAGKAKVLERHAISVGAPKLKSILQQAVGGRA